MKKLALLVIFVLSALAGFSQAPQGLNYQGVARNAGGTVFNNVPVTVTFVIHNGSAGGNTVFQEMQTKTTNQYGLFNMTIGSVNTADFALIPWASGLKFLEVDITVNGNQLPSVTTQMLSVPYALYAERTNLQAGNNGISISGNTISNTGDNDNNPANEIQTLTLNGNNLSLSQGGGSVQLPAPPTPTREIAIFEYRKGTPSGMPGTPAAGFNKVPLHDGANTSNIILNTTGNTITLQPGNYLIQANSMAYAIGRHQVVLRNQTTGIIELLGTNEYSNQSGSYGSSSSLIYGKLAVGVATSYILDHWVQYSSTGTDGFGVEHTQSPNPSSTDNVYARVIIEKL